MVALAGADEVAGSARLTGAGVAFCFCGSVGPILTSIAVVLSRSPPERLSTLRFISLSVKPISRNTASFSCNSTSGTSRVRPDVGLYSTGVILKASCMPGLSFLLEVRKLKPKNLCFFPVGGNSRSRLGED